MKIDFGMFQGKPIETLPIVYLESVYESYKPQILAIERCLKITPRERRSEKIEIEVLFDEFKKKYPDNEALNEYHQAILKKLYEN
jgi:hypothetical protein